MVASHVVSAWTRHRELKWAAWPWPLHDEGSKFKLIHCFKQDSPDTPALWLALIWSLASSSHCYRWLVCRFLTYCPSKRILSDEGLKHEYFRESPLPIDPSMFPTWPAKSEQQRVKRGTSPRPPEGGLGYSQLVSSQHPSCNSCFQFLFKMLQD